MRIFSSVYEVSVTTAVAEACVSAVPADSVVADAACAVAMTPEDDAPAAGDRLRGITKASISTYPAASSSTSV
jgi:hypothetical protein